MGDETPKINHDGHWKRVTQEMLPEFLAFCMPDLHEAIDYEHPIEFLDKEFPKLFPKEERGGEMFNDKLIKVKLKDGQVCTLLVHIEIQTSFDKDYAKKMFGYFARIYDKFGENITSIVVYTGLKTPKLFKNYDSSFFGSGINYFFNSYKVKEANEEELLASENPFALVVLAAKYVNLSKKDNDKRAQYKAKLIKLTVQRNYPREKIVSLLRFIELMLVLPPKTKEKYKEELNDAYKTVVMKQPRLKKHVVDDIFSNYMGCTLDEYVANATAKAEAKAAIKAEAKGVAKASANAKAEAKAKDMQTAFNFLLMGLSPEKVAEAMALPLKTVKEIQARIPRA